MLVEINGYLIQTEFIYSIGPIKSLGSYLTNPKGFTIGFLNQKEVIITLPHTNFYGYHDNQTAEKLYLEALEDLRAQAIDIWNKTKLEVIKVDETSKMQ